MPLTSLTTCYRTLPSYFADKVTQQMRKRRDSYLTTGTQGGGEENEIIYNKAASFSNPESVTVNQTLMTNRSCTPLVTVSDNESEDGSTPRDGTGGDACRSHSANPNKADSLAGYVAATANHVARQQRSPRTAISLDNVDLWEEEEESDCDDRNNSPGFDRINGVPINPRSTIDFSELRRSRSPVVSKRNKSNEDPDGWISATSTMPRKTMSELMADMATAKKSLLEARNKPRIRTPRKVPKATPVHSNPRKITNDKPVNVNYHKESAEMQEVRSACQKRIAKDCGECRMPPLSSTYTFTDSNPALVLSAGGVGATQMALTAKMRELNRTNGKLAALRSTTKASPKPTVPGGQQTPLVTRDDLKRVRDLDSRCSTDSNLSSGSAGTSPERKVKFNNFVTVRRGEVNTYGYLRESQNSAQIIKQKYLGSNGHSTMAKKS
ncbi:hypothetical protein LSH36_202g08005 [Paralvinella palmiformis]|uniref:Uncharacterized protein n=1 Tax=Paralvinella palmiformis TaxID=53620 RepID=A0AAD9JQV2_9ANNE|nr:hypothetical protein LSH36_202g08005 [Paralvinella palmiformis]